MVDILTGETGYKERESEKPLNILLVEDDPMFMPMMQLALSGHHVTSVTSVEEALNVLRKAKENGEKIDCVITDRGLERKTAEGALEVDKEGGFRLAASIMAEGLGHPFVIMVTGSADMMTGAEYSPKALKEKGIDQLMGKTFLGGKTLVGELRNSVNKIREFQIPTQGPQS